MQINMDDQAEVDNAFQSIMRANRFAMLDPQRVRANRARVLRGWLAQGRISETEFYARMKRLGLDA